MINAHLFYTMMFNCELSDFVINSNDDGYFVLSERKSVDCMDKHVLYRLDLNKSSRIRNRNVIGNRENQDGNVSPCGFELITSE